MKDSQSRNHWGTVFLLFAAVGFGFFTLQPWWTADTVRFFRAFFEASLVGALADWFAVTALFKRPLGLPLPHTDVLVRRKDQLVEALPRFFASFLEPEHIHPVLKGLDWSTLLLNKVEPQILDELVQQGLKPWLASEHPTRKVWEQQAIGLGADLLHRELTRHKDALVGPATELIKKNAGWKGFFVSHETVAEVVEGLLRELLAVRDDPAHALRRSLTAAFHEALPEWADQLRPSLWTADFWKRLETDTEFRRLFDQRIGTLAVSLWERAGVAGVLTESLRYLLSQTDARSLAVRIEQGVGNDLQYIRVNGALVGGLAGLVLEALKGWTP